MAPSAIVQVGQISDDEAPNADDSGDEYYNSPEDSAYQAEDGKESEEEENVEITSESSGFLGQSPRQYAELLAAGVVTNGELIIPAPHDDESDTHHPGFIDDNYGKELRTIETEYKLPQDDDPPQDWFLDNQGPASIELELYGMGLQEGSWDDFLFEQLPPEVSHSINNYNTQGNYIEPNVQHQALFFDNQIQYASRKGL
ncbi:Protein of unknown function [Pyronema omphalodes CBS 100304]|uniref:Uncharacterized protein n=1 Tax=Pyronema omphalodes (strain CBS 100304) TaxID=1076935 RepID=U4L008_PYROM|nr:Protein of unknown function [Pyronema omphalodes CBS 100304]